MVLKKRSFLDDSRCDHDMKRPFSNVTKEVDVVKSPTKSVYHTRHPEVDGRKRSRIRPRKYLKRVIKEIEKLRPLKFCDVKAPEVHASVFVEKNHFRQKSLNTKVRSTELCSSVSVKISDFRKKVSDPDIPATELRASLALSPAASIDSGVDLSCDLTAAQTFRHVHQNISQNCTLKSCEANDNFRRDSGDHFLVSMSDLSWLQSYKIQDIIQPLSIAMDDTLLDKSSNTVKSCSICPLECVSSNPKVMNSSTVVNPAHSSHAQNDKISMDSKSQGSYCSSIDMKLKELQSRSTIYDGQSKDTEDVDFSINCVTDSLWNNAGVKECSGDQGTVNQCLNASLPSSGTDSSHLPLSDTFNLCSSSERDLNAVSEAKPLQLKLDNFDASTCPRNNLTVSSGSTQVYNLRSRAKPKVLNKCSVGATSEAKEIYPVRPNMPLSALNISENLSHQTELASDKSIRMVFKQTERQYALGCLRKLCTSHFLHVKQDLLGLLSGDELLACIL